MQISLIQGPRMLSCHSDLPEFLSFQESACGPGAMWASFLLISGTSKVRTQFPPSNSN